ncbi:MAG: bleomycin resistance family protein [Planctomycetota bacterium]|nr:bleomycin resistance family protein [Planctomycetota bacterium]
MEAKGLTPILNVSDIQQSFAWFEKLGWRKGWEWGKPATFGGVCSGTCELFLCENGQGGRGKSDFKNTFGPGGSDRAEKGAWVSIWVDDVDAVHQRCLEQGLDVTWPPTNMPWGIREMHVRHPDGHVFRVGRGLGKDEEEPGDDKVGE